MCKAIVQGKGAILTAAIEGFLLSPAGGWVTSAPRNITGSLNTLGLQRGEFQLHQFYSHNPSICGQAQNYLTGIQ